MFDFENANDRQREAIRTSEGPVLIIAGPGTGKTYGAGSGTIGTISETASCLCISGGTANRTEGQ